MRQLSGFYVPMKFLFMTLLPSLPPAPGAFPSLDALKELFFTVVVPGSKQLQPIMIFGETSFARGSKAFMARLWPRYFFMAMSCSDVFVQVRGRGLNSSSVDWCEELKRRTLTGREVEAEVAAMSPRLFHDSELSISDFTWFDDLLMRHNPNRSLLHLHIIDALLAILEGGARYKSPSSTLVLP